MRKKVLKKRLPAPTHDYIVVCDDNSLSRMFVSFFSRLFNRIFA
jgi:hypothetical protein